MDVKTKGPLPAPGYTTVVKEPVQGNLSTLVLSEINYRVKYRLAPWWKCYCLQKIIEKQVLCDVNLALHAGQLIALLGSSGSGKTSLLDIIACRAEGEVTGSVKYNGITCTREVMKERCSYVIQADRLLPNLTVRETLTYTAYLKLPGNITKSQINEKVESVINKMGLRNVSDSRVGGSVTRGISGGEKRRVTIAIQLLHDPDILLLDEPTTGLDSFTARHLVASLQQLARQGKLVIMSIHQPRSDIALMLDQTAIMCDGQVVYFGPTPHIVDYFTRLGYPCPTYSNPLDNYMDITSIDRRDSALCEQSTVRVKELITSYAASVEFDSIKQEVNEQMMRFSESVGEVRVVPPSWIRVFTTILSRFYVNLFRERMSFLNRFILLPAFVPFIVAFLGHLENNQSSIQDRIGLLYQSVQVPPYVGIINALALFPTLRNHFYREGLDGLYSSATFLVAYTLHISPFTLVASILFSVFLYWITGLNQDQGKFGMYVAVVMCLHLCGELLSVACMGLFRNTQMANNTSSILLTASGLIASGFLRATHNMILPLRYLSWASIHKYSSEILAANEFHGLNLTCTGLMEGLPCIPNGQVFLNVNYPGAEDHIQRNFQILVAWIFIFLLLAMLTFRIRGLRVLQ